MAHCAAISGSFAVSAADRVEDRRARRSAWEMECRRIIRTLSPEEQILWCSMGGAMPGLTREEYAAVTECIYGREAC